MKRLIGKLIVIFSIVFFICFAMTGDRVAFAAGDPPLSNPNGPWLQPNQEVSLSAIRDYDQLVDTLKNIVHASNGAAQLAYAPYPAKGSGRLVPYVKIGTGIRKMIVIAQQHGNEYVTSNGAISLIRDLSKNDKQAKFIRSELTLYIVPRVNIDGFDATTSGNPWRYNVDPSCTVAPCPPFYGRGQGYDINRYHPYLTAYSKDNPNTPTPDAANPVPESLNVRALYDLAGGAGDVEVVIDLHHQGSILDANRDLITGSTLWPTATPTADALVISGQLLPGQFDQVILLSKRVVSTLLIAMDKIAQANFSKYVGGPEPGISRNAYGLLGSASVLMEHRLEGQKANGYMANIPYRAVMAVIQALADGSLYTQDTARAEALQYDEYPASLFWKCLMSKEYTLENYNFCREKLGLSPRTTLPDNPFGEADLAQELYELATE